MDTEKATPEKVDEALHLLRELNPNATIITTPIAELGGKKVLETMQGKKIDLSLVEEDEHEHHHEHEHDDHDHEDHDHHCDHGHEDHDHHCNHDHDHDHHCDHDHEHEHDHDHHHDGETCSCGHHHHDGEHHHHHADEIFDSWGQETVRKYTQEEIGEILAALSDEETYGNVLRAKGMVEGSDGNWIYFDMVPEEIDVRSGDPEYTGRLCVIGASLREDKLAELFKLV